MTNEVTIKEQPQITKIAEFFETTGLVEFFTEQYGYPRELICREGLAFTNKITLHDLQENNANRQFKNCSAISKQQVFCQFSLGDCRPTAAICIISITKTGN